MAAVVCLSPVLLQELIVLLAHRSLQHLC